MAEPSFFDVVRSQRGVRFYKPDPVSGEDVDRILRAAVRAPSASNKQDWVFVVVRDPGVKRRLGELYREGQQRSRGAGSSAPATRPQPGHFAQDMEHVPVIVMVCIANGGTRALGMAQAASIYPAAQNLMLAAAALGLGTRLTTIWHSAEAEIKELLGIPDDYSPAALIPLGYPAEPDHLGGSLRSSIADVTFNDRWGNRPSAG